MASVSSSNWLDRLRSSRGFPTGDDLDFDRFLSTSSSGSVPTTGSRSTHSESTQSQPPTREVRNNSGGCSDVVEASNVLCDLFNMGEGGSSRGISRKKSSRKQANPRFCSSSENNNELCSSDDLRRDKSENGLASSGDNSLNERREKNAAQEQKFDGEMEEREDEDVDLKAYSRSDVFVIDTSLKDWKFDGWVFRKKDEWKIKEKKGKSRVCGGKKRKLLASALNSEDKLDRDDQKKRKMNSDDSKGQPQNDKKEQTLRKATDLSKKRFKEAMDSLGKVPQKRCPCPRPPEKFGNNEGPTVILLKSIPLTNSSGAPIVGKSSHKKRPKQMKIV